MDQHITLFAGDSKKLTFTITDEQGGALDISGAVFNYKIGEIEKSGAVTDGPNGIVTVKLDPADTASLPTVVVHELEMTDPIGNVSTVFHDTITIQPTLI